jgi:hypothetical protein
MEAPEISSPVPPKKTENAGQAPVPEDVPFEGKEAGEGPPQVPEEAWKDLVNFVRTKKPILGAFLAFGELVHLSDDRIEIGFEKDSFHFERMLENENRGQLEQMCGEFLGRKAKLIISPLAESMRSRNRGASLTERVDRNGREKTLGTAADEHPIVQEALRLFDGRIVEG